LLFSGARDEVRRRRVEERKRRGVEKVEKEVRGEEWTEETGRRRKRR